MVGLGGKILKKNKTKEQRPFDIEKLRGEVIKDYKSPYP